MFKFNYMFIIEVIVKGGVVLDNIIFKGVSIFLSSLFTYMYTYKHYLRQQNTKNTSEYKAVKYNNTYDLNTKTYNWINTSMTTECIF